MGVAFDGVIPVADVEVATRAEVKIDGDEGEVGGEDEVEFELFGEVVFLFGPGVELDFVGRLVAGFDEAALHFGGPEFLVDELVSAGAGVGLEVFADGRVLGGVGGVGGVEGGGEDGVGGDVVSPFVEGDSPGVGVGVSTEGGEFSGRRVVEEPGGVLGTDGTINGFDLGVVEDGFTEEEVAAGGPGEVVEGMVGVFATEAGEEISRLSIFPSPSVSVRWVRWGCSEQ